MTQNENYLDAAIEMQRLCSDSYLHARMVYKRGWYRMAKHYQQQAARDHAVMVCYLEKAKNEND